MNKKENSKNLVKKMLLSIFIMSCFAVSGVENVNAMNDSTMNNVNPVNNTRNSIFGQISKREPIKEAVAPIPALAANNSRQNITPVAPVSAIPTKQLNSNYGRDKSVLESDFFISDENIKKESKIIVDTKEKSGNNENEPYLFGEFSLFFPQAKNVDLTKTYSSKDVIDFFNRDSFDIDSIPLGMYSTIINLLKGDSSGLFARNVLRIWGVDIEVLAKSKRDVPIIANKIACILLESISSSKVKMMTRGMESENLNNKRPRDIHNADIKEAKLFKYNDTYASTGIFIKTFNLYTYLSSYDDAIVMSELAQMFFDESDNKIEQNDGKTILNLCLNNTENIDLLESDLVIRRLFASAAFFFVYDLKLDIHSSVMQGFTNLWWADKRNILMKYMKAIDLCKDTHFTLSKISDFVNTLSINHMLNFDEELF